MKAERAESRRRPAFEAGDESEPELRQRRKPFFNTIISTLSLIILSTVLAITAWGEAPLLLTESKVKDLFLAQGLQWQVLTLARQAAQQDLPEIRSRFDTALTLTGDHQIDQSARASTFFGSRTDTSHWNLGLEKLIPSGTTFGFQFLTEREKSFGASAVSGIPRGVTYEPALEFRLDQSLGENFFGKLDRAEVRRVQHRIESFDYQTRHEIQKQIAVAQAVFWRWALAREAVAIGNETLIAAQEFLAATAEKEKLGLVEPTDRLGAEAMAAKREALLLQLKSEAAAWEAQLKTILNLEPEAALAVGPHSLAVEKETGSEAVRAALQNRFDLLGQKKDLEAKKIRLVIAKQKILPTLDLKNTLQLNEVTVGRYAGALQDMDSPDWKVAMELRLPLENRSARAEKSRADLEKRQALLELKQLEVAILHDVTQKWRSLQWTHRRWEESQKASALEGKKLAAALDQYRRGRFSAELILQYQDDLLEARREALLAKLDLALARLALTEAKNTL